MSMFHLLSHEGLKALIDKITAYFYTKSEIDDMLSAGMRYEVVDELPATGEAGTVYLVPKQSAGTGDVYDEYIYVDGSFEHIGSTEIDLSNYYTKTQTDNLLGDKVDKESGKGLSTEDFTTAEKTKLGGIEAGAEVNAQSDWNQSDSTKDDYIKNKPTLRQPSADGTAGQYLKSNGNGNAPSWETMDSSPTANSTKAVTSGGVKTALDGKQAKLTGTVGSSTHPIYQKNGVLTECNVDDMLIKFCTDLTEGKSNLTTMAIAGSNRFAGMDSAHRYYEVSSDGTTWAESANGLIELGQRGRLVIHSVLDSDASYYVRTNINRLIFRIFGKLDITVELIKFNGEVSTYVLPSQGTDKEWHDITIPAFRFGDTKSATNAYIRTIRINYQHTPNTVVTYYNTRRVMDVYAIGRDWWNLASNEAKTGKSYTTNYTSDGEEVTFPSKVTAKAIITSNGTANQVLLANGDVMSFPVPINKGGTGQTTAQNACNAFINALSTGTATPMDSDYYVCQFAGGGTSTTTYHRRPMSSLWTYIKGKISTVLGIQEGTIDGKVNLQPDFTASQIDYSAGNVGKWQKVLRFPEGADLVINMKKTAMGSDSTSTLWFSSSSMGDSYTSLFGNHSVRFIHDGGYVFLVLACRKSTYEPIESYTFQIAHSSVPMSDIVAVTEASPITATPKEPSIVYRAPMTTGAVSFNVSSSGAGSVAMANHNDFLGNMTSEASNGVVVTMSGATEGQIYRFVFTRNITGGVTFKQSNVAYCTISGDVNAGDTITLTAVSNTADGWLYEQESAGIESSDGSNIIEYNGSTADVRVNWEKLPARVVMNVADDGYEDDKNIAIGYGASTYKLTGDENYPYAYTTKATFEKMKVDGGAEEYTHAVTAGTTYSIVRGGVTTSFTPAHSGYAVILKMSNSSDVLTTQYPAQIRTATQSGDYAVFDKTLCETEQYVIVVIPISAYYAENIGTDSSYAIVWILSQNNSYNTACGYGSRASGSSSSAFGLRARANDASSLATGADALASDRYATAAGDRARAEGRYSSAYGSTALANGEASSAIGASTNASGRYSTAIGHNATAKNYMSTAVGNGATASGQYTEALGMSAIAGSDNSTALGSSSKAYGYCSTAVGNQTRAGLSSTDANRPYRRVKNFTAVQFTYGGDSILSKQCETDDAVTMAVNGNNYTLTPPDEGYTLVVLNDANAQYINGIVTGYLKINGAFGYYLSNTQAVSTEVLSGNYCAVWIKTFTLPSEIASLSFVAYYTDPSSAGQYQTANGYNSEAVGSSSVAVGHNVTATRDYQVVIGSGNLPDYDALFIVGAGGNVANGKKNILTVDYREQLQVKGVRTQVARMTTSGTISGVNNIYLISSGCTVALPSTGEEGQVLKVCAEGNCTVGGVSLEAGKFREYVCAGGTWYTRE